MIQSLFLNNKIHSVSTAMLITVLLSLNLLSIASGEMVIAIGDIHGDITAFKKTLLKNGIINKNDEWICGSTKVIQMGDLIDRGDNDKEVIEFAMYLEKISILNGGEYIQLLGNHEIMNLENDFRYAYDDYNENGIIGFGSKEKRIEEFKSSSKIGRWLREKQLIYKWKDDTIFVHGGISNIELSKINTSILNSIYRKILNSPTDDLELKNIIESVIWNRKISLANDPNTCNILDSILNNLGVKRMVVGHTITNTVGFEPGEIGYHCDGKIILSDVGMSNYYKTIPFTGNVVKIYDIN